MIEFCRWHQVCKAIHIISHISESFATIIIEASGTRNRGILQDVLLETELSTNKFIEEGVSSSFLIMLRAYSLAVEKSPDDAILEQFRSCFCKFGLLTANISVLESRETRNRYKCAVLNIIYEILCISIHNEMSERCIIQVADLMLYLDEKLNDEEDEKDHTGLGCWVYFKAILLSAILREPELSIRNHAVSIYKHMYQKIVNEGWIWSNIADGIKDLNKNWRLISSSGSSCCWKSYLRNANELKGSYIIDEISTLVITIPDQTRITRFKLLSELTSKLDHPKYPIGHFIDRYRLIVKTKLFTSFDVKAVVVLELFFTDDT